MPGIVAEPPGPARRADALPAGFGVAWDPGAVHLDGGRVVVGGTPTRLIRLSDGARSTLSRSMGPRPTEVPSRTWARMLRPLLDAGLLHPVPGPAQHDLVTVTVVVPVRDRWESLYRLLPSLGDVARVVVVDDGSTDGSGDVAAAIGADVVRHPTPRGPAAARNAGLALVTTPLVAFIDSDIRVEPGWHQALLPHFNDPSVAVVAPRVVGHTLDRADRLARYEVARSALDIGERGGYVRSGNQVSFLPAATLVARTEAMRQVGGFDRGMHVGEDVDLVWRLGDAGWRVRYEPAASVSHDARPSLPGLLRRRVDYGTSAAALHRRHPGKVAPIGISPWSAAVWAAAVVGRWELAAALAGLIAARLATSLAGVVDDRWRVSWLVAGGGLIGSARMLAAAVSRTWLPLALVASARWPRTRLALVAALLLPPITAWWRRRPGLGLLSFGLLHLADDAAYCLGVWLGCVRHRTLGPLLPRLYRQTPILPSAHDAVTDQPKPPAADPEPRSTVHAR